MLSHKFISPIRVSLITNTIRRDSFSPIPPLSLSLSLSLPYPRALLKKATGKSQLPRSNLRYATFDFSTLFSGTTVEKRFDNRDVSRGLGNVESPGNLSRKRSCGTPGSVRSLGILEDLRWLLRQTSSRARYVSRNFHPKFAYM